MRTGAHFIIPRYHCPLSRTTWHYRTDTDKQQQKLIASLVRIIFVL
jgi:hypothetical protein